MVRRSQTGLRSAERATELARIIPGGSSTRSKEPHLVPHEPGIIVRGQGCRVWDADDREFIDFKSALGPVTLGYRHPAVDAAIATQLRTGIVFGQPTHVEGRLAEQLVDLLPWADQARFLKTGGEAVAACIKIARAHTGRDHVVHVGYNGWLNGLARGGRTLPGQQAADLPAGVPASVADLHHTIDWGDASGAESVLGALDGEVAAVVVAAGYANMAVGAAFLPALRRLADQHGAVLVIDEVVTGLRLAIGGAGEYFGVTPDLAVFAKGLANGMPLSAYVGRREVLSALDEAVVTSTNAGETLSLAAALAVLDVYRREPVVAHLWDIGARWWASVDQALATHGLPLTTAGFPPCRALVPADDAPAGLVPDFLRACFAHGLVLHGVSYVNYAHQPSDLDEALERLRLACRTLAG